MVIEMNELLYIEKTSWPSGASTGNCCFEVDDETSALEVAVTAQHCTQECEPFFEGILRTIIRNEYSDLRYEVATAKSPWDVKDHLALQEFGSDETKEALETISLFASRGSRLARGFLTIGERYELDEEGYFITSCELLAYYTGCLDGWVRHGEVSLSKEDLTCL